MTISNDPVRVPSRTGSNSMAWLWLAVGFVLALMAAGVLALVDTQMIRSQVYESHAQPAGLTYENGLGRNYHVEIAEQHSMVLNRRLPDKIFIGHGPGVTYGHPVYLQSTGTEPFESRAVEWSQDGVRIEFTSGHELFVPASAFTGGR
ncbi:hypothetical protein [Nocardia sp. NPDC051832]|uniref:hypothetical protein n=1 Tax=Nocardia sp. NPDC051832 TaxID=3155673 RepID=UPI00343AB11B